MSLNQTLLEIFLSILKNFEILNFDHLLLKISADYLRLPIIILLSLRRS